MKNVFMILTMSLALTSMASEARTVHGAQPNIAELSSPNGTALVKVEPFPDNPEVIVYGGQIFVANSPVIGFGRGNLHYHLAQTESGGQGSKTQTAELSSPAGTDFVTAAAFPDNPEIIVYKGQIFVANSPVIGFGIGNLHYHLADGVTKIN